MQKLVLGTRGSALALKQVEEVAATIMAVHPHLQVETRVIKTTGDENQKTPLAAIGSRGLFVKQIEDALLQQEIDVAVHSLKDLPSQIAPGLLLAAVSNREDPRDAWVSPAGYRPDNIPNGGRVGTSSLRRAAQLLNYRPDLQIIPLRGNIKTRLQKAKDLEAIVIAVAGLKRLGLEEQIKAILSPQICLPAVGQGALGVEIRENDPAVAELVSCVNDQDTAVAIQAERAFLKQVEGGCQVPVGAWGRCNEQDNLLLTGMAAASSGFPLYRCDIAGSRQEAVELGTTLAKQLLTHGAGVILAKERQRGQDNE